MVDTLNYDIVNKSIISTENRWNDKIQKIVMNSSDFRQLKNSIAPQYKYNETNEMKGILGTVFGIQIEVKEHCNCPILIDSSDRRHALSLCNDVPCCKNNKLKFIWRKDE